MKRTSSNDVFNSYLVDGARFCGSMELPALPKVDAVPDSLTEFRRMKNPSSANQFIHFYIHDRKFESVYKNPAKYLDWFRRFAGIIGFDYSIHAESPLYKQIDGIARSRELSFWYSKQGINVIPNVRWGMRETFSWCFDGLPRGSTVAVSTLGCVKDMVSRKLFVDGFWSMLEKIEPKLVIVYGSKSEKLFPPLLSIIYKFKIVHFESHISTAKRKEAG